MPLVIPNIRPAESQAGAPNRQVVRANYLLFSATGLMGVTLW